MNPLKMQWCKNIKNNSLKPKVYKRSAYKATQIQTEKAPKHSLINGKASNQHY